MSKAPRKDNRTALIDSAEELMAEHGIGGISLRAITAAANVNSAALHYHFGNRDRLVRAVLERRGIPNHERRLEILDELESRADNIEAFDVVGAILDPMVEMLRDQGVSGRRYARFHARLLADQSGINGAFMKKHFPDTAPRVLNLALTACPDVPEHEVRRRIAIVTESAIHTFANPRLLTDAGDDKFDTNQLNELADSLKNFLAAGLSAPYQPDRIGLSASVANM